MFKSHITPQISKKTVGFIIVILVLSGIGGVSYYKYYQAQQQIAKLKTPEGQQQIAQRELESILTQIKKHMLLPDSEQPTLATITDIDTIKKDQPFFERAQNGDKILVYVASKKAIIYRPEQDLIVNVGFIAVDGNVPQPSIPPQKAMTVEVRNGTTTVGIGQKIASVLKGTYDVQKVSASTKQDYTKTIIIDLGTASNKESITALAKTLGADIVTSLPEGEVSSTASVIVIVGSDKVTQ